MTHESNITSEMFNDFAFNYAPRSLFSLRKNILYLVDTDVETQTFIVDSASSDYSFEISSDDAYLFYQIAEIIKSFRFTDYQIFNYFTRYQIPFLLTLAKSAMSFYSLDYQDFIPAGKRRNKIKPSTLNSMNSAILSILKLHRELVDTTRYEEMVSVADIATSIGQIEHTLPLPQIKSKASPKHKEIHGRESLQGERIELIAEKEKHTYEEIEVHYATNRGVSQSHDMVFDNDRDPENKMHYGKAVISIPHRHKRGKVERPIFKLKIAESRRDHFTILRGESLDSQKFYDEVENNSDSSVMIFIHGFNVSFKDGALKAAQLKCDLKYKDPIILFSWPSKGALFKYGHDKTNAEYSSGDFQNLVESIAERSIKNIYILAHSMGSICASMGLHRISPGKLTNLRNLIYAAPDIDKEMFKKDYAEPLTKLFDNTTIYMSKTDLALKASLYFVNGYRRLGDTKGGVAVFQNADSIDATDVDDDFLSLAHSYASTEPVVVNDIYHLLFNNLSPPKRNLKKMKNYLSELYWKFI